MTTTANLSIAVQLHQTGRLQDALEIYLQIWEAEPKNANALHLLGELHALSRNPQLAVDYIDRALSLKPDWAEAHRTWESP
jgi:tetratricopeptide (TPR) repeat protein